VLVFSGAFITYLDRVCISVAGPLMQSDVHLNNIQFAWVVTVFYISYGVMELPSAWRASSIVVEHRLATDRDTH
jgi:ACS family glucarate transporter-like MFS transporter